MTEEFDEIMNKQLSEKLREAGYVAPQANIELEEELPEEEVDLESEQELHEEVSLEPEIIIQGKRTCMVKQKFKEALANIRYIYYNNHLEQKLNELDQEIATTKESIRVEKAQISASEEFHNQKKEIDQLRKTVAVEQENLEKLSQQGLTEDQIVMMQNLAAEHQRDLQNAKRELEKNSNITAIRIYRKQIERLKNLKQKRMNQWMKVISNSNVDPELRTKFQERIEINEKENQHITTQNELENIIRETEEEQRSYNDTYWESVNELSQEALKTGDATALEVLNAEKANKDQMTGEILQDLNIRKQYVSDLLEKVSKQKKRLSLQTSLPYLVAKGFASVASAAFHDIKEAVQSKKQENTSVELQPIQEPVAVLEDAETMASLEPQRYDANDIEYRTTIYENVNAILDSSVGDDIGRLQFANLLESYRRMYHTEEETKDKEKQK